MQEELQVVTPYSFVIIINAVVITCAFLIFLMHTCECVVDCLLVLLFIICKPMNVVYHGNTVVNFVAFTTSSCSLSPVCVYS